jgi:cytoskeletal protein CcmA (bactofilin family)
MWKRKRIETIIGPETRFEGEIQSNGTLRIDGVVYGGITYAEEVIVGETGEVKGDVNAKNVIVLGTVTGNINASDSIEMLPECRVNGDIKTTHLSIDEGVIFEGGCIMTRGKTEIIIEKAEDEQHTTTAWSLAH